MRNQDDVIDSVAVHPRAGFGLWHWLLLVFSDSAFTGA
jgi:hypothetical protein